MNGQPWNEYDLAFLRANYGKMSAQDLADAFERSVRSVYMRAEFEGLAKPIRPWMPSETKTLKRLNGQG